MPKNLFISGCSTGIGRACALHFAKNEYCVYAGVRKASDAESLKAADNTGNLEPVILDVTNESQLSDLKAYLSQKIGDVGLVGIINNAAIARGGPLEYVVPQVVRDMFNVNVMGPLLITQTLLPLVRTANGRIVNIGSIGGKIANPMAGGYSITKFGLEAFNDSLRQELAPQGIHVSLIEPGPIDTPTLQSSDQQIQEVLDSLTDEGKERYGNSIAQIRVYFQAVQNKSLPPQVVVDAAEHALESERPKTRYLVTKEAKIGNFLRWMLSDRALDMILKKTLGG